MQILLFGQTIKNGHHHETFRFFSHRSKTYPVATRN